MRCGCLEPSVSRLHVAKETEHPEPYWPGRQSRPADGLRLGAGVSPGLGAGGARAPVARLSFAATGADAPQLLGGLIKKEVGIVGHEVFLGTTIHPVVGVKRQVECGALLGLYSSCFQRDGSWTEPVTLFGM